MKTGSRYLFRALWVSLAVALAIAGSGCNYLHGMFQVSSGQAPTLGLNANVPLGK